MNSDAKDFVIDKNGTITGYSGSGGDVVIPPEIGGIAVRAIAERVFVQKNLTSVVIPAGVEKIGEGAFAENKLVKTVIPDNVTVGRWAFMDNEEKGENLISEVTIGNNVTHLAVRNGHNFPTFYEAKKRKAGTYIFDEAKGTWCEKNRH